MVFHHLKSATYGRQSQETAVRALLGLLHVNADSAFECEACSRRIWIAPARDLFSHMAKQKEQHNRELRHYSRKQYTSIIEDLPEGPSRGMWLHSLWLDVRVELSEFELYVVLKDVLDSEEYVLNVYQDTLEESLEDSVVELIERQRKQILENIRILRRQCMLHSPNREHRMSV